MRNVSTLTKLSVSIVFLTFLGTFAQAVVQDLYAVSADNSNIYKITIATGTVTTIGTIGYGSSISLACDGSDLYYWNFDNPSHRGLSKWNPSGGTNTVIDSSSISEENACVDSSGNLWILDRSDSLVDGAFLADNTRQLLTVNKTTGARTAVYTLPDVSGDSRYDFAAGDIAWGSNGKLYISTFNTDYGYDTVDNYIWDPLTPASITKIGGDYYAGLAWANGKLYGSKLINTNTSAIFELDPSDFSVISQITTMPTGVTLGDLSTGTVPEPATIVMLSIGGIAMLRRRRV